MTFVNINGSVLVSCGKFLIFCVALLFHGDILSDTFPFHIISINFHIDLIQARFLNAFPRIFAVADNLQMSAFFHLLRKYTPFFFFIIITDIRALKL